MIRRPQRFPPFPSTPFFRSEIPMITAVVFIPVETPDAADDHERADAIVPIIAQVMKTKVRARIRAFETGMIVDHELWQARSEEHTSELQSRQYLVCRLLLEK